MCRALRDILEFNGYQVETAHDGRSALAKIESEKPDAVLLDIRLPGMNGIEVLKKAKKLDRDLPVVMITAYGDKSSAKRSMAAGAFDYILKPFGNHEIIGVVKRCLLRRNRMDRAEKSDSFWTNPLGSVLRFLGLKYP